MECLETLINLEERRPTFIFGTGFFILVVTAYFSKLVREFAGFQ
jgi:hypothetical protein